MPWELLGVLVFAASFAQAATGIAIGTIIGLSALAVLFRPFA